MGKRKKIVARMEELYPNTNFTIECRKPLCIKHDNLDLCDGNQLIKDFIFVCRPLLGDEKTMQAAIYYDFENN